MADDLNGEVVMTGEQASAVVRGEREARKERLRAVVARAPGGKLAKRAGVLLLDYEILDDLIEGAGGEDELVFMICAQVASGVTLKDWCEHYSVERGLVWALLSEDAGRLERYYRALEGVADEYVGEVVGIADGSDPERLAVDKWRGEARLKVAGKYARGRYGESVQVDVRQTVDVRIALAEARARVESLRVEREINEVLPDNVGGEV